MKATSGSVRWQRLCRRGRRGATAGLTVLGLTSMMLAAVATTSAAGATAAPLAADPCALGGNAISCENSKPGSPPSEWDISGSGDSSIQGFSTDISANVGQRVDFKVDTDASAYSITIYRSGYYGGSGARKIATVSQPAVDCWSAHSAGIEQRSLPLRRLRRLPDQHLQGDELLRRRVVPGRAMTGSVAPAVTRHPAQDARSELSGNSNGTRDETGR